MYTHLDLFGTISLWRAAFAPAANSLERNSTLCIASTAFCKRLAATEGLHSSVVKGY